MGIGPVNPPDDPNEVKVRFVKPDPRPRPQHRQPDRIVRQAPTNHTGPYELRRLGMAITEVTIPKQQRESKYDYSGQLDKVRDLLAAGKTPGEGGFDSPGKARSASNALLAALNDDDLGARVYPDPTAKDKFAFGITTGRRQFKQKRAAVAAAKGNGKK